PMDRSTRDRERMVRGQDHVPPTESKRHEGGLAIPERRALVRHPTWAHAPRPDVEPSRLSIEIEVGTAGQVKARATRDSDRVHDRARGIDRREMMLLFCAHRVPTDGADGGPWK